MQPSLSSIQLAYDFCKSFEFTQTLPPTPPKKKKKEFAKSIPREERILNSITCAHEFVRSEKKRRGNFEGNQPPYTELSEVELSEVELSKVQPPDKKIIRMFTLVQGQVQQCNVWVRKVDRYYYELFVPCHALFYIGCAAQKSVYGVCVFKDEHSAKYCQCEGQLIVGAVCVGIQITIHNSFVVHEDNEPVSSDFVPQLEHLYIAGLYFDETAQSNILGKEVHTSVFSVHYVTSGQPANSGQPHQNRDLKKQQEQMQKLDETNLLLKHFRVKCGIIGCDNLATHSSLLMRLKWNSADCYVCSKCLEYDSIVLESEHLEGSNECCVLNCNQVGVIRVVERDPRHELCKCKLMNGNTLICAKHSL